MNSPVHESIFCTSRSFSVKRREILISVQLQIIMDGWQHRVWCATIIIHIVCIFCPNSCSIPSYSMILYDMYNFVDSCVVHMYKSML